MPHDSAEGRGAGEPSRRVLEAGAERLWKVASTTPMSAALIFVLAAAPRLMTAGHHHSVDEARWLARSESFIAAMARFDFASASSSLDGVATMPGITTVWVGGLANQAWRILGSLGLIAPANDTFANEPSGWATAQVLSALVQAALIVLVWWTVRTWAGATVGLTAAVLLATEPFLVGHGAVLHTDSTVALLGTTSVVAFLASMRLPDSEPRSTRSRRRLAVLAGVSFAGAVLTKLNALLFGPFLLMTAMTAFRRDRDPDERRETLVLIGFAILAGVAATLVAWPAIWADTSGQLEVLRRSAELSGGGHLQFFRGEITWTPGPTFYPFVVAYRASPWLLGIAVLGALTSAKHPDRRSKAAMVACWSLAHVAILSISAKQLDRYALVWWPAFAILAGFGVAWVRDQLVRRWPNRDLRPAGAVTAFVLVVHALLVAPWGVAWFSPALGGTRAAEHVLLIGWGEGLNQAGSYIQELEGDSCDSRRIGVVYPIRASFPCGELLSFSQYDLLDAGDYLVLYVGERQRTEPDELGVLRRSGRVVHQVWIRGILYAEVIQLDRPPDRSAL